MPRADSKGPALLARAPTVQALLPFLKGGRRELRARGGGGNGAKSAPVERLARSAVSLSHPAIQRLAEQLELGFYPGQPGVYIHEGARQALERRLTLVGRCPVSVSITDNRHSMIHAVRRNGMLRARLHHMFLDANVEVIEALGRFLFYRDREASTIVGRYIDENTGRIRILDRAKLAQTSNRGAVHDLDELFAEVNETYFDGQVDARIAWGHEGHSSARCRTTIKLGSYTARERLIRIHPRLDQTFVPRYFISFVVFHEMLHHVIPATRSGGRRVLHPPEFRTQERQFRHYERSIAWERTNLDRLLG